MNSPRRQGLVSDPLPLKGSLGKWLIPGVGQGIYKMSLENLMVPEKKNVLKEHSDGGMTEGQLDQPEKSPRGKGWKKLSHKIYNTVLG